MTNKAKWNVAFMLVVAGLTTFFFLGYRNSEEAVPEEPKAVAESIVFDSEEDFGRALFFDLRLSSDRSISCASCHRPELAFTDGESKSIGVGGRLALRNASTLLNVKDAPHFTFDATIKSLEEQALIPIQDSNEMNLQMGELVKRLNEVTHYTKAAKQLYDRELDSWVVTRALASFEQTLVSKNSLIDRYLNHNEPVDESIEKGWKLFNSMQCIECHRLPNFTNYQALNNGLYTAYGEDPGKYRIDGDTAMMGAFKVPTLRNVALTGPYMHDGSFNTLEEVIDHYANGGVGSAFQDKRIKKRTLSTTEKKYLINFLQALTDTSYMREFQ